MVTYASSAGFRCAFRALVAPPTSAAESVRLPRVVFAVFVRLLHRGPGLARNLSVGFNPTQTSLRSVLRPGLLLQTPFAGSGMPPSSGRRSTSRHVRYRTVSRTNRTLLTANTHNHYATSSTTEPPACAPSLPWQYFCADASPGACTDVASQDGYVSLLGPPLPTRPQQGIALLADVPQSLFASTGLLTRKSCPRTCRSACRVETASEFR